jgi:hypothetical protein
MSVSAASLTPFLQVAATGSQMLATQLPLLQSCDVLHCRLIAHFGQTVPPQSTAVSSPSRRLSLHIEVLQAPHTPLEQHPSAAPCRAWQVGSEMPFWPVHSAQVAVVPMLVQVPWVPFDS